MINKTLQVSFKSDLDDMNKTINTALNFIGKNKPRINKNDALDIKLVLNELLCNAVVHGNKKDKTKNVYLKLKLNSDSISSVVADEGDGFDYVDYMSNYKNNLWKESGRGIKLASNLTNSIAFNTLGNEIKFYKKVSSRG